MIKAMAGVVFLVLAGCVAVQPPDPTVSAVKTECVYRAFVDDQRPYYSGTVVTHLGKLYRAKHDNPGYIPSISTYYWAEVTPFMEHRRYYQGDVVTYQGRVYLAEHDNPAYLPTVSTYYWTLQNCPR